MEKEIPLIGNSDKKQQLKKSKNNGNSSSSSLPDSTNSIIKGIYDLIDIKSCVYFSKSIQFVSKEEFFYKSVISHKDSFSKWIKLKDNFDNETHEDNIKLLMNNTVIDIKNLFFENCNGHKYNLLDKYFIIDIVGKGSFGVVLKCWCKTNRKYVSIKIIEKKNRKKETLKYFEKERNFLINLNHENILKIYEVEENDEYLLLILEHMEWCTLKQLIIERYEKNNPFNEEEISLIMKNILQGINYMHYSKVMHRDIKPENIMFKKVGDLNSLKIIDLGLSTSFDTTKIKKFCGTIKFMAPEIVESKSYYENVDIWAAGIILFILLSGGKYPFEEHIFKDLRNFSSNLKFKFNKNFTK